MNWEACRRALARAQTPTATALAVGWHETIWPGRRSPRRLLRLARLALRYDLRQLIRARIQVRVPSGQVPDCPTCQETCCQGPHLVSLRLPDIARLVDGGLEWAIERPRPSARASLYAEHPDLAEAESLDSFRRFPVLGQTDSGYCVFLDPEGRCAIYPLRPLACRRFPYRVGEDRRTVTYATGCRYPRADGSAAEVEALVSVAVEHYNQKIRDLVMLEAGLELLARLGLDRYVGGGRSGSRLRFNEVLDRVRTRRP